MIVSKLDKNDCKDCSNPEKQTTVSPPAACAEECIKILDSECIRSTSDVFCRGVEPNPLNDVIPVIADAVCMETLADFFVSRLEANSELAETLCTSIQTCPAVCPAYSGTCTLSKTHEQFLVEVNAKHGVIIISQQYTVRLQHKSTYAKYRFELFINGIKQNALFIYDNGSFINNINVANNTVTNTFPVGTNFYIEDFIPTGYINDQYVNLFFTVPLLSVYNVDYDKYNNQSCVLRITPICGDESLDTTPFDLNFTTPDYKAAGYNVAETVSGVPDYRRPNNTVTNCAYKLRQKSSSSYSLVEVHRDNAIPLSLAEQQHNANVLLNSTRVRFKVTLKNNNSGNSTPTGIYSSAITLNSNLFESNFGTVTNVNNSYATSNNNRIISYYEVDVYDYSANQYVTIPYVAPINLSRTHLLVTRYFPLYSSITLTNASSPSNAILFINTELISRQYRGLDLSTFIADYAAATKPHITSVNQVFSSHQYTVNASLSNGNPLNGIKSNQLKVTISNGAGGSVIVYVPLIAHVPSSTSYAIAVPKMYFTDIIKITNLPSVITSYGSFMVGLDLYVDDGCLKELSGLLPESLYYPQYFI